MITLTLDIAKPFGIACLFWAVILMAIVLFDKEAFIKENKPRWKVAVLSVVFLIIGAWLIWR